MTRILRRKMPCAATHPKSSDASASAVVSAFSNGSPIQAADISYELAHGLLLHPPMRILDPSGTRKYDKAMEEEANWLGPALLVSDEAAMHIAALG
ncbi:ImmA/IrrE family metallo-endopeptidase [Bradyrhizobium uaiense]|uniref:ImmA/IrrE family metallo-endopeptidase n=1 Tax=Bradyrhizobium uaiense TaxID=2594946 RepID=A0A6P1BHD3_9BRAD|nr:ImmA/IrrE family metallo-endopeptidase [Bradyrhizobium uaiense]NEU97021.1 ImmA/IrrE family metallo-endopeptidase [Bradyrhizobium uaiense]